MKKEQIINSLITKHSYKKYLEIGVRGGDSFKNINCETKIGVDPRPTYRAPNIRVETSDQFFDSLTDDDKFDIVFIDGLHLEHQSDKDVANSINHLSKGGLIVMHDCSPKTIHEAREVYEDYSTPAGSRWNGTVYKTIIKLRCNDPSLYIYTVNCDEGCAVLDPSKTQETFTKIPCEDLLNNFDLFSDHRKEVLNLISPEEFKQSL